MQTYAYFFISSRDFLKFFSLCLSPSSYPRRQNSFVDTQVWKPEILRCPLMSLQLAICFPLIFPFAQQEDWVVSCWNSHSSSSISSSHLKPPLAAVCTVSKESWRTRQVRYVKNFGLNASSQNQLPEVSDWCHMMNCSLLAALPMEGPWIPGWCAPNLFVRARHLPALYCKGKARLWTGQSEFSPFSSGSFQKTVCVPSSLLGPGT